MPRNAAKPKDPVGIRIGRLLRQHGLTAAELARITSTPTTTLGQWLRGDAKTPASMVPAIADALGVSYDEILGRPARVASDPAAEALAELTRLLRADPERIEIRVTPRDAETSPWRPTPIDRTWKDLRDAWPEMDEHDREFLLELAREHQPGAGAQT